MRHGRLARGPLLLLERLGDIQLGCRRLVKRRIPTQQIFESRPCGTVAATPKQVVQRALSSLPSDAPAHVILNAVGNQVLTSYMGSYEYLAG